MVELHKSKDTVTSGIDELDRLLDGLHIGDNVVWHDQAGSLASVFCLNLIRSSKEFGKPAVYVTFDRSPRNLLEKLGNLGDYPSLTIMDCFTHGKGAGSEVFLKFYREAVSEWPCRIVKVEEPRDIDQVVSALQEVHTGLIGDVRYVFESLTGMQELWGGEKVISQFYTHFCPRLYELNTVAYWILEKEAHSERLRAQINQIAQVVIDLSIRRGKTALAVIKAEKRNLDHLERPFVYWARDLSISFGEKKIRPAQLDLGAKLKETRARKGVSQSDLAKLVGVTPSTISQIEGNLIYPSLPALMKMAEVLSVDLGSFFQSSVAESRRCVFPANEAEDLRQSEKGEKAVTLKALVPPGLQGSAEPYLVEIAPRRKLTSHFLPHKGEEVGYVLSGRLTVTIDTIDYKLRSGDMVSLTAEIPSQWKNHGPGAARLLWVKIKPG